MKPVLPLLFFVFTLPAFAQSADASLNVPTPKLEAAKSPAWKFGVDLGATTSWGFDQNFVGVPDGHYLTWGGKVSGRAIFTQGPHTWRNSLSVLETFSKTPVIDAILKSADQLSFESIYLYNIDSWWGAFAQLNLDTSVFAGKDIRAANVTYNITDITGAITSVIANQLTLTDPFKPLYLRQAIGLFATPVKSEEFNWEIKASLAARESFAAGQRFVSASTATTVAVSTLANFYQLGPAVGTTFYGELMLKKVAYKVGGDAMYVAYRSSDKAISTAFSDRTNFEAFASLSFKLVDWAALTWDFKALRVPEVTTDVQLQSNLLLTMSYSL